MQNYGDLLFPLILKHALKARIHVDAALFSPSAHETGVQSIFDEAWRSRDAIVIGGGDIISFKSQLFSGYKRTWSYPIHPHGACWILPSIQRRVEVPVLWNAPGVPFPFTQDESILVRSIALQASYLSVRDAISKRHLQEAGVEADIVIVPDTALLLPSYWTKEELRPIAAALLKRCGLEVGQPIVFQMHPRPSHEIGKIVRLLKSLGRPIFLLPISYAHKDHQFLAKISKKGKFHFLNEPLDIRQTAALIAHAQSFIGTSLHGAITAYAYAVPYLTYNLIHLNKLDGFAQLVEEPCRLLKDLPSLLGHKEWLERIPCRSTYQKLVSRLHVHFDTIANLIQAPVAPPSIPVAHYLELLRAHQKIHYSFQEGQQRATRRIWPVGACTLLMK